MDPRNKTWELSESDPIKALEFARSVADTWKRVQCLSIVARFTLQRQRFKRIVTEALKEAQKLAEPNRNVSCSAWVIRAMTHRDDFDAAPTVGELIELIQDEPNPVRRADALLLLLEAVYPKPELRAKVLTPLLSACKAMKSWKQPRLLSDVALILAIDDSEGAERVMQLIQDESALRKTRLMIEQREYLGPHEFFPYYSKVVDLQNTEAHPVR